jgi:futalosine hydrolase
VICAGIAGGFQPAAPVGSLVVADAIVAADLGAETPEGFVPVTELGFGTVCHLPPPALAHAVATATGARPGTVLTVSTVTGTATRAAELTARHPDALAEAMEGFGVAEAAAAHGVPVLELRAVSNPVGPRDRPSWRIPQALTTLTTAFTSLPPLLSSQQPKTPTPTQNDNQRPKTPTPSP